MALLLSNFLFSQNNVVLTWDSEVGCQQYEQAVIRDEIKIFSEEIADNICLQICENNSVNYELTGTLTNVQSVEWIVAGGNPQLTTGLTNTIEWLGQGFGAIQLNFIFTDSTTASKQICIEKINAPKAEFLVAPNSSSIYVLYTCINQAVTFDNISSPDGGSEIISQYWDFGDGSPISSGFSPSHTFTSLGEKIVVLTVKNTCNCTATFELKVIVREPGIVISCPNVVCENDTSSYSVPSLQLNGCTNPTWSVEGGTVVSESTNHSSIQVLWDQVGDAGFGYVTLDTSTCNVYCAGITTLKVPVIETEGQIIGEVYVCERQQYRYKLPQWPSTLFQWSFINDGDTGSTIINTDQHNEILLTTGETGVIILRCKYVNTLLNCEGVAYLTIKILPKTRIIGEANFCVGSNGVYQLIDEESGTPVSGDWTLEGPNFSQSGTGSSFTANLLDVGTYMLQVSGIDVCNPEPLLITVVKRPNTPAGINGEIKVCPSTPYTYSVVNPQPGFNYFWSIVGAPNTGIITSNATGNEVSVVFASTPSNYTLSVVAIQENEPRCYSHATTLNINRIIPNLDITTPNSQVCRSTIESYAATYQEGEYYEWSIIPSTAGSVSSDNGTPNITVLWNNHIGLQPKVKLIMTKCNQNYSALEPVTLVNTAELFLTASKTTVCRNESFFISLTGAQPITSYDHIDLDFGNGESITLTPNQYPLPITNSFQYETFETTTTNYTITAVIYGANGCLTPSLALLNITVIPAPVAHISPAASLRTCDITTVNIVYTASIQTGFGVTDHIEWFINTPQGQTLPYGNTASIAPNQFGTYYAVVYNTNGCSIQTNSVSIIQDCEPAGCNIPPVTVSELSVNLTACGVGTASIAAPASPAPYIYDWLASGGVLFSNETATSCNLSFPQPGNYMIYLKLGYLDHGVICFKVLSKQIIIPYQADLKYTIDCENNNNYAVDLLNHSVIFPGNNIQNFDFYINGVWYDNNAVQNFATTFLPPGNHSVGIRITNAGQLPCEKIIPLYLPPFPVTTFTVNNSTTCQNNAVVFTPTDTAVGNIYTWDFGDVSFNSQQSPTKVYANSGPYNVTLTITNVLGCTSTTTLPVTITVLEELLSGNIIPTEITKCEGEPVTLTFNSTGATTPHTYIWYNGTEIVYQVNDNPQFSPTESGNYWVQLIDTNGCIENIFEVAKVRFIKAPQAVIEGPNTVCVNTPFSLNGYLGGSVQYRWYKDGLYISSYAEISETILTAGTHLYTLEVLISNGAGGYCTSTANYTVTVLDLPAEPTIAITNVDCAAYTIKLVASASEPGFFTWSTGIAGETITINDGGSYRVRFTNLAGCTSFATITIPKAPSNFLWVFPSGCYQFCDNIGAPPGYLIGPLEPVNAWDWQIDNVVVDSDLDTAVANLPVEVTGEYQLTLNTGLCAQTSEPLHATVTRCDSCNFGIYNIIIDRFTNDEGICGYKIKLYIQNGTIATADIWTFLSSESGGTFSPAGLLLEGGTHLYNFIYYPPVEILTDTTLTVHFTSYIGTKICVLNQDFLLKSCPNVPATKQSEVKNYLKAIPNPARTTAEIQYSYGEKASEKTSLVIYTMLGIVVETIDLKKSTGVQLIDVSRYSSGVYYLVLKQNNRVVNQTKLLKQ